MTELLASVIYCYKLNFLRLFLICLCRDVGNTGIKESCKKFRNKNVSVCIG